MEAAPILFLPLSLFLLPFCYIVIRSFKFLRGLLQAQVPTWDPPCLKPSSQEELVVGYYRQKCGEDKEEECSICMCKLEEGEEIRELRCQHLFHKLCLDRWMGCRQATCPLCRGSLRPGRLMDHHDQELIIPFSSFHSTSVHSTWWLR